MPTQLFSTDTIGSGIQGDLGTADDAFVHAGATVSSTDTVTIRGTGSDQEVGVDGTVIGQVGRAIILGNDIDLDSGNTVSVRDGGYVAQYGFYFGVSLYGWNSEVENDGTIWGTNGVFLAGTLHGDNVSRVTNRGTIDVSNIAIELGATSTEGVKIYNDGLIRGTWALHSSSLSATATAQIVNIGQMEGDIFFGKGDDVYDGHLGSLLGKVLGNDGNDRITGNAEANTFDGGVGNDVLIGGGGNDFLFGSVGNDLMVGGAGADTFHVGDAGDIVDEAVAGSNGIDTVIAARDFSLADTVHVKGAVENMFLTGLGNYNGTGNGLANVLDGSAFNNILRGRGGNDTILGEDGADTLRGDAGNDTLIGGLGLDMLNGGGGNDRFKFNSAGESTGAKIDVIQDFDDAGNDRIDLSAVFGGTLTYKGLGTLTGVGQVHIKNIAGPDVLVEINLAGDATPEMTIRLANTAPASMTAGDFVL